jgi:hypothetical protein
MLYAAGPEASDDSVMTEGIESRSGHAVAPAAGRRVVGDTPPYEQSRTGPNAILVWVGIVAGVVFIVAVVFFAGFFVGRSTSGVSHGGYQQPGMMLPGETGPYGQMWPGMMGPGGMMGPNSQWPGQQPTTTAPTTPRP